MELNDIIANGIALVAFVVAVFSWLEAKSANKNTLHNTKTFFDSHIASSRDKVRNMRLLIAPLIAKSVLSEDEKKCLKIYRDIWNETKEEYLNALNQACNAYNANRLDKKAFELEYKDDIRRVYKSGQYDELLNNTENDYSSLCAFKEVLDLKSKDEESI